MEITLFDAVPKALEWTRLVRVGAVDEDPGVLSLEREPEVHVRAEAVRYVDKAELIQFIINFRKGVLEHMFLALKHS